MDTLIVATGATHAYFGNDQWEPLAPGLKTVEDATEIRSRVLNAFEEAERETDPDEAPRLAQLRHRWGRTHGRGTGGRAGGNRQRHVEI